MKHTTKQLLQIFSFSFLSQTNNFIFVFDNNIWCESKTKQISKDTVIPKKIFDKKVCNYGLWSARGVNHANTAKIGIFLKLSILCICFIHGTEKTRFHIHQWPIFWYLCSWLLSPEAWKKNRVVSGNDGCHRVLFYFRKIMKRKLSVIVEWYFHESCTCFLIIM